MRAGVSIGGTGGLYLNAEKFAVLQKYQPTEQWARTVCEYLARRDLPRRTADRLARSKEPGHVESLAAARVLRPVVAVEAPDWRPGFLKALHGIEVPMLLVAGAEDELFEQGWADRLAERIPRGRAVTLAGTRHQPHIDEPTAVANLVLDFIEGVPG
jgi:pimeloyl-ACP methyl ester carboxylesterase